MLLLETLPPGEPSGGVVYLRNVLSPEEASCLQVFLNMNVLQGGVVSTSPNPQAGGPSLVGCPRHCLFNLFAATLHKGGRSSIRNLRTRHDSTVLNNTIISEWWIREDVEGNNRGLVLDNPRILLERLCKTTKNSSMQQPYIPIFETGVSE